MSLAKSRLFTTIAPHSIPRLRSVAVFCLGLILLWLSAPPSGGQMRNAGQFPVTLARASMPAVAADAAGNFVVAWSVSAGVGNYDVYLQRFDARAAPITFPLRVNQTTTGIQWEPSIAMSPDGRFVVTWESAAESSTPTDAYFRLYDANAQPVTGERLAHDASPNHELDPVAVMDEDGNFVVIISRSPGNPSFRRYDAQGQMIGVEQSMVPPGSLPSKAAASNRAGQWVLAMYSTVSSQVRRFSSDGALVSQFFMGGESPSVAIDTQGRITMVWQQRNVDGSGYGVRMARVDANNQALGPAVTVNTYTAGEQRLPAVACDANGGLLVIWQSTGQDGSGEGIYGQRFSAEGQRLGGEFRLNTSTVGDQGAFSNRNLAATPEGNYIAVWRNDGPDGGGAIQGDLFFPIQKPVVTLDAPREICLNGALLSGTVHPGGGETTVRFEFRPLGQASWAATAEQVLPPGMTIVPVSASLSPLLRPATEYEFRLMAANAGGSASTESGNFTTPANRFPVAAPGGDVGIEHDAPLILDASSSSDPDAECGDSIALFEWDLDGDGNYDVSSPKAVIELPPAQRAAFLPAPEAGETSLAQARLRVTDGFGGTGTATFTITIWLNEPGAGLHLPAVQRRGLTAHASAAGSSHGSPHREIVSFEWDFDHDPAAGFSADATGSTVAWIFEQSRIFTVALRVTDNNSPAKTDVVVQQVRVLPSEPELSTLLGKGSAVPGRGEEGGGIPAEAVFQSFGVPSINDVGQVVFTARWKAESRMGAGVFSGDAAAPVLVAAKGDAAPAGGDAPVQRMQFLSFQDPLLSPDGGLAFIARLTPASSRPGRNDGIFARRQGESSLREIARTGMPAAGASAGMIWKTFTSVALDDDFIAFTATLGAAASASAPALETGLWIGALRGDSTDVRLALQTGQKLFIGEEEKTVKRFVALQPAPGAAGQGHALTARGTVVRADFTDKSRALLRIPADAADAIEAIVLEGEATTDNVTLSRPGIPTQSGSGAVTAWLDSAKNSGAGEAVFAKTAAGDELQLIAQKGDFVSGVAEAASLRLLLSVAANDAGQFALATRLSGFGLTRANDLALLRSSPSSGWEVVARKGAQPPGIADGARWAAFPELVIAEGGQGAVAFIGRLSVPSTGQPNPAAITSASNAGLWALGSDGKVHLVLRKGGVIGEKKIRSFTALGVVQGSPGQRRSITSDGSQLLVRVTDTAGAQHLVHVRLP